MNTTIVADKICLLVSQLGMVLLDNPDQLCQLLEEKCTPQERHRCFLITYALQSAISAQMYRRGPLAQEDVLALELHLTRQLGVSREEAHSCVSELTYALLRVFEESCGGIEARPGNMPGNIQPSTRLVRLSTRQRVWVWFSVIVALLFISFAVHKIISDRRPSGGEFRIALLAPLTGPNSRIGQAAMRSAQMAAEDINEAGGIRGYNMRVVGFDVPKPENASQMAEKAVFALRPEAVISVCGNRGGALLAEWSTATKTPMLAIAGMPEITGPNTPYVFRLVYDQSYEGKMMAYVCAQGLGRKNAAVFYRQDNASAENTAREFEASFRNLGGNVTLRYVIQKPHQDLRPLFKSIAESGVEALVFPENGDTLAELIKQAREAGHSGAIIGGSGYRDGLWTEIGGHMNGTWWVTHLSYGDPHIRPFLNRYAEMYRDKLSPGVVQTAVLSYDGVQFMADALRRASNYRADGVRSAMASTKNLPLTHATLTMDPDARDPRYKAAALMYCASGKTVFQKRVWIKR